MVRFQEIEFGEGYLTARLPGGETMRFTRRERSVLSLMAAHPGRLFTRDELLDAANSEGSDRGIDFIISRIRSKLGDTGAERRFISTQYGEGYVWVATPASAGDARDFLVLGPLREDGAQAAEATLRALQSALQERLGAGQRVRLAARPDQAAGAHAFILEATVHAVAGGTHAALVLRQTQTGRTISTFRERFSTAPGTAEIRRLADAVMEALWKHLAVGFPDEAVGPTDLPLHLRLHATALLLDGGGAPWRTNGENIARLRSENPADPELAILWGMHLFGRMTIEPGPRPVTAEANASLADEIVDLVFTHLAAVREDPVLALAAAKLLLGAHRGHEDLAESLAEAAFTGSAAFAAAFPMLAQIKACKGDLAEALRLFDEGLRLCRPGSDFELYIQVLKASTLIAAGDWPEVERTYDRLHDIAPTALSGFALLFLPSGDGGLARRLRPMADKISEADARRLVAYALYRVASYFGTPGHAANILRGPLTHMVRRFGPGVATPAMWRNIPAELHALRRERPPATSP